MEDYIGYCCLAMEAVHPLQQSIMSEHVVMFQFPCHLPCSFPFDSPFWVVSPHVGISLEIALKPF